jgi:excisionase family DNA binding protein
MAVVPELATITEAATRYKCHPKTIRRLIDSGDIGVYRVGPKIVRIDIAETDAVFFRAGK